MDKTSQILNQKLWSFNEDPIRSWKVPRSPSQPSFLIFLGRRSHDSPWVPCVAAVPPASWAAMTEPGVAGWAKGDYGRLLLAGSLLLDCFTILTAGKLSAVRQAICLPLGLCIGTVCGLWKSWQKKFPPVMHCNCGNPDHKRLMPINWRPCPIPLWQSHCHQARTG